MYLLLKAEITEQDVRKARALLKTFVVQMGELYTLKNVSYNVHQLLHLADSENLGPVMGNLMLSL